MIVYVPIACQDSANLLHCLTRYILDGYNSGMTMDHLTPIQIVAELDKYIVGQKQAKRAVAIALRNRYRRSRLGDDLRDEVIPKNILMVGPTGVGKTDIARRLSGLKDDEKVEIEVETAQSPFVQVFSAQGLEEMNMDLQGALGNLMNRGKKQ